MRDYLKNRVRILAWLALFFAPLLTMEIGREVRYRMIENDRSYLAPTAEFRAAVRAGELASAER